MKITSNIKVGNDAELGFSTITVETTCHGFIHLLIPIKDQDQTLKIELHRGELREFLARTCPEFVTEEHYKASTQT